MWRKGNQDLFWGLHGFPVSNGILCWESMLQQVQTESQLYTVYYVGAMLLLRGFDFETLSHGPGNRKASQLFS